MTSFAIKITLLVCLSVNLAEGKGNHPSTNSWEDYKNFHGKMYVNDEHEGAGRENFERNAAEVAAHNKAYKEGKVSYTKELNAFADIDPKTFQLRNGIKGPKNWTSNSKSARSPNSSLGRRKRLPASFDWRKKRMVTPVKQQGQCGSCWAFSAVGGLESAVLIAGKPKKTFSEQQLVSCDSSNYGCRGGWYNDAWDYIKNAGGIESDNVYPYTSQNGDNPECNFDPNNVEQTVSGFEFVGNDEQSMMQALVDHGPLSVALDASHMQLADDGIYSCDRADIDHAVLLIGYGSERGQDYWILKNSWGTGWGNKGFFKVARGDRDCGLKYRPAYPKI